MYSYTLLRQTWEGSKCLSNRRKKKEESETKARVIPLWETRNKTAWHQSPPKETHTHTVTQSHQSSMHSRVHTHIKWLLGCCSDTSDRARQREWRDIQHMQTKRTSCEGEKKNTARDHPGNLCVFWRPLTQLPPHTDTHTYDHQPSCLVQYWKAQHTFRPSFILMHSVAVST